MRGIRYMFEKTIHDRKIYIKDIMILIILFILPSISLTAQNIDSEFIKAAKKGKIDKVQTLMSDGASINSTDKRGRTALMLAAEKGHSNVVKLLLEHGADISTTDNKGETALAKA